MNDNRGCGTGVLNNEMHIGRLVWNRLRYAKDPETGKRRSRANVDAALVAKNSPELAIVTPEQWEEVKARQTALAAKRAAEREEASAATPRRRSSRLVSGLMRCGVCGGGFTKISAAYFGCSTARNNARASAPTG